MAKYLDKFLSTIPQSQANSIFKFLTALKDQGSIRTEQEYNTKLRELTAELNRTVPEPTIKIFLAVIREVISSDSYNAMVRAAGYDMETAFKEAEQISEVLSLHKSLYKLTVPGALKKAIDDLERKIDLYEFLNSSDYSIGEFNTFNNLRNLTDRTDPLANQLYYDFKARAEVLNTYDANIDLVGEELLMPAYNTKQINITDIIVAPTTESTIPKTNLEFAESDIKNIIDNTAYTYWLYPVLLDSVNTSGVKVKLKLLLGNAFQTINTLHIEPACNYPMVLESLIYSSPDGTTNTITANLTINVMKSVTLNFSPITTDTIYLVFRQDNYEKLTYYHQPDRDIWDYTNIKGYQDPEENDDIRLLRISKELNEIILDKKIRDICNIPDEPDWSKRTGYQYMFGFDNIKLFNSDYKNLGIFVGPKITIKKPGIIAMKSTEANQTTTISGFATNIFSFEYYIVKRNFDSNGGFIDTETLPILPIGYNKTVPSERLIFSEASGSVAYNVALLNFVPDISAADPVIKVNLLTELAIGTDFYVKVGDRDYRSDWATVSTDIDALKTSFVPLEIRIKIANPSITSIYTISYKIKTDWPVSDYITLQRSGNLFAEVTRNGGREEIEKSDIYPVIIMRRNHSNGKVTCSLEEYKLLMNTYDSNKFN